MSSLPQGEHTLEPAAAKDPAGHVIETLVPSHAEPAGHLAHAVRVVFEPPDVNQPVLHIEQLAALSALYKFSAPHATQAAASAADEVPARHGAHDAALPSA